MLDEKDLQAIQSIIADAEQRITKNTVMMMETKFEKRFNLLAEGQSAILEKLERLDDMEVMDTRITALEAMEKKLNRDIGVIRFGRHITPLFYQNGG